MTVVCVSPITLTVQQGVQTIKPVAQCSSTSSLTRKVRFNELVRMRRTAFPPRTIHEHFQAIWFTQKEIIERIRKDKRLRHVIARQPEKFGMKKSSVALLSLGLYTDIERLQRSKRISAARASILSKNNSIDMDSESDSDDSSNSLSTSYAICSEAAAVQAHERALRHYKYVQTMDNTEDDASEGDMSQMVLAAGKAAPQEDLPRVLDISNHNPPHLVPTKKFPCSTVL
ncbi:unnamed protein product [Cylindrotheca closterium]|uniref:Uncharacterized protein n=1 Tax=Cylindrotheca closterium TaxID=2856 RepID=A0AAD2CV04_9STRA|nr:unnamed protein product [Cylindrotheca closterium]